MDDERRIRGVFPHKEGGWVATIGHKGETVYLGFFTCVDDANEARREAEVELYGAVFERRKIVVASDVAKIPLHGHGGKFYGWAVIDVIDLRKAEGISWTRGPTGYVIGRPPKYKRSVSLHRWILFGGRKGGKHVDHKDRDRLNNRRSNLRACSPAENTRNTNLSKNNSTGAKGVSQTKSGKFRARIWKDWKEIYLGIFERIGEASAAYDKAAKELHGEFASVNSAEARRAVQ